MNPVALVLLILHLFIVSCADAGTVVLMNSNITLSFEDMEAYFSPSEEATVQTGVLYVADPLDACQKLRNKPKQSTNGTFPFALIVKGGCTFEHKVRNAQGTGFKAAIVHDNVDSDFLIAMEGDKYDTNIQAVFVSKAAGETLKTYVGLAETRVMLVPSLEGSGWRCTSRRNDTSQLHGMSRRMVKAMPSVTFTSVRGYITTALSCAICLEDYSVGDKLRVLPCCHNVWLTSWRTFCPVCKRDARISTDEPSASESTPLLAVSSLVNIVDPSPVGSSLLHTSSSYSQQPFGSVSDVSWPSAISVSHISADFRQQAASPLRSTSLRSYITCIGSLDSPFISNISSLNEMMLPYQNSPSNASPGFFQSTSHRFNSLLCRESEGSSSHYTSAHSLEES
ncbi:Receptor y region [Hirschfeldia incana]|nr:Receptor y region [Hirschfeldia incana]